MAPSTPGGHDRVRMQAPSDPTGASPALQGDATGDAVATGTPRPRRRRRAGIRVRIVIASTAMVAAALGIAVLVTWQVLLNQLDRRIEQELQQEVEEVRLLAGGIDPATGEPFGDDTAAIFDTFLRRSVPADHEAFYTLVGGAPFLSSFDAPIALLDDDELVATWAAATSTQRIDRSTDVGEARMLVVPLSSPAGVEGTFVIAYFPDDELSEIGQAMRTVVWIGVAVLVVAAVVAWSVAGQVLRPVRRLTTTARGINESDLSGRIPVEGHDELAELGHTFNEMVERLDGGFRAQRQFLDDVAHELRTPITIARGHLELLGHDPTDVAETVAIVDDELDRMGRYVTDLLVLAKAEQPDFLHEAPVDLGELVLDVHLRASATANRAWMLDAAPPPGSTTTAADGRRLEQALLNLVSNAVQHTHDGDEIGLGVMVDGTDARLSVRDTGPGIDPDVLESLFVRSSRGATSRATRPDGTGIGLSIVDAIARAHGGRVEVVSQPGHGATFTIVIPGRTVATPGATPRATPNASPDPSPTSPPTPPPTPPHTPPEVRAP